MVVTRRGDPKFRARVCDALIAAAGHGTIRARDIAWKLHVHPDDRERHNSINHMLVRLTKKLLLSGETVKGRGTVYTVQDPGALTVMRDALLNTKKKEGKSRRAAEPDNSRLAARVNYLAEKVQLLARIIEANTAVLRTLVPQDHFTPPQG